MDGVVVLFHEKMVGIPPRLQRSSFQWLFEGSFFVNQMTLFIQLAAASLIFEEFGPQIHDEISSKYWEEGVIVSARDLSEEKKKGPGCSGYMGDSTIQLYRIWKYMGH